MYGRIVKWKRRIKGQLHPIWNEQSVERFGFWQGVMSPVLSYRGL